MEPVFIYYNNLGFDQNKRFTFKFSDLEGDNEIYSKVLFLRKNKNYYKKTIKRRYSSNV